MSKIKYAAAGVNNPFKEKQYTVVLTSTPEDLAEAVDAHMAQGWLPWGSLVVIGTTTGMSYCQAMISAGVLDGYVDILVPRIANMVARAAKHPPVRICIPRLNGS